MRRRVLARALALALSAVAATAAVTPLDRAGGPARPVGVGRLDLPAVFSDHLVLQRDRPAPVWGRAPAGARVTVEFAGQTKTATAAAEGAWRVDLAPMAACAEPRSLRVTAIPGGAREIRDVLVGEVWLAAGQSNMRFFLRDDAGASAALAEAGRYPGLRFFHDPGQPDTPGRAFNAEERRRMDAGRFQQPAWRASGPDTASTVSAVAWYFGRRLHLSLKTPVGVVVTAVGGSAVESWLSREALAAEPLFGPALRAWKTSAWYPPFNRTRRAQNLGADADRLRHPFDPSFLYDEMIAPLAPLALRGVLWYQGESNAEIDDEAYQAAGLPALIRDWRATFRQPEMPFFFVQLPRMNRAEWPRFREAQSRALAIPGAGMAVALEWGDSANVHPKHKEPVGERLALLARARVYGERVPCQGPTLKSVGRAGARLRLQFAAADGGLKSQDGQPLRYFTVAGADRRFVPAQAEIRGDTVEVWSAAVSAPAAARYAWLPDPEKPNFFNGAGLSAAPFRTDRWAFDHVPVRVACIGDSITYGTGLKNPALEAYPARLQTRLPPGWEVRNFGLPSATVSAAHPTPGGCYRRLPQHREAMQWRPDVVICNLGINDAVFWADNAAGFEADYAALLADYAALPNPPVVLIWHPLAPLFPGHRLHNSPDLRPLQAAIRRVADEHRVHVVDMRAPLANHPEWFPDRIHPDSAGADAVAQAVFTALRGMLQELNPAP